MKITPAADDPFERVAIGLNLAPLPGALAMYGMVAGRVVGVAQRLGLFGRRLGGPATAGRLAVLLSRVRESMKPGGTLAVLECSASTVNASGPPRGARAALSPHLRRRSAQPGRAR